MFDSVNDGTLSLKVMIDKQKNKVLFAEVDNQFVDILLSFLTLPLGTIIKVLKKQYGDKAPTIGSLSSLYHSLENLDSSLFWTMGAKKSLLNPPSSFTDEYDRLKLDISHSPPIEYYFCYKSGSFCNQFHSASIYYDQVSYCRICNGYGRMIKSEYTSRFGAASIYGVFTKKETSFIISDDLHIFPNEKRLLQIFSILGITDIVKAEQIKVDFGLSEIMNLLKTSLTSPTPLSDIILNKTTRMNSAELSLPEYIKEANPNSKNLSLKVKIQISTGKLLYAVAEENFIEFLFSLLNIPIGGVEHLLDGKTCFKAINNLYRSTSDLIDVEYFKTPDMKNRLMKPNLVHGCISNNHILPLTEEPLPEEYSHISLFSSSAKFPEGKGSYLIGPKTYKLTDDLTVAYCFGSSIASLTVPLSDVKQVDLQIGLKEGLRILEASLTSTSVLTDALLKNKSNKRQKRQVE